MVTARNNATQTNLLKCLQVLYFCRLLLLLLSSLLSSSSSNFPLLNSSWEIFTYPGI